MAYARIWHRLTRDEAASLPGPTVALAALGAVEQHGPHLPLETDTLLAEAVARRAIARATGPVVILPTLSIGVSPEHQGFGGTISLSPATLADQIAALAATVARAGLSRLMLVNGHGGNIAVLDQAALDARRRHGLAVAKAHLGRLGVPAGYLPAPVVAADLHGGAIETAVMLALAPHRVGPVPGDGAGLGARFDPTAALTPEGPIAFAWTAEDLSEDGVIGAPDLATAEIGRAILDHWVHQVAAGLDALAAGAVPPASGV